MIATARYTLLFIAVFLLIFTFTQLGSFGVTSLSFFSIVTGRRPHPPYFDGIPPEYRITAPEPTLRSRKANATLLFLAQNSDLNGIMWSLKQIEDRFNKHYNYPYVFLNEVPFTKEFRSRIQSMTSAQVEFGLIPKEHWDQPKWVNETIARNGRDRLAYQHIPYATDVNYRNMCRFNSGFFFRHPLLAKYKYAWRVEPGVSFLCDINDDPFVFMREHNKIYGFTISLVEYPQTIRTLWINVKKFMNEYPELISPDNALDFISQDEGRSFNLCHFWSNFEITDLDFWRSEAFLKFFDFLDKKGGFYYERWGDAPFRSIAVALLAKKDQIHFFDEIGYRHAPFQHCPQGELIQKGKCWCDPKDNFDYEYYSCLKRYQKYVLGQQPGP